MGSSSRQNSLSSTISDETTLVPTTDIIGGECPRFRILIVGRSGTGKSSLINTIFKTSLAEVQHDRAGSANISEGITSEHNKHLILHDSEGYEPGNEEKFRTLEKFVLERSQMNSVAERLHAIWLCITVPYSGGRIFETGEEKIFALNRNKVPIILVFTKLDLLVAKLGKRGMARGKNSLEYAEKYFNEQYRPVIEKTKNVAGQVPYTLVSISQPETLQQLVKITMRSINSQSPSRGPSRARNHLRNRPIENDESPDEDLSDCAQIALATAQRVDMAGKIAASIKVGKKKYWRAIASGMHFLNISLQGLLYAIHKDIITIWNIRDLDEFLLSDAFCRRMMVFVDDLFHQDQRNNSALQGKVTMATAAAGLANLWANGVYKRWPEHVRCLMGYVVDLTLVLQAVFQVSLQDRSEGKVTPDRVNEIIYEFHFSEKKKRIHNAIRAFRPSFTKGDVVDEIESLIKDNEMTKNDTQFDQNRPPLPSLLTVLRLELTANGLVVNQTIIDLVDKLLDLRDYNGIVSQTVDRSDVELLLDFILYLLHNHNLSKSDIQDANRKARKLMFKLISKTDVIPSSLYITNVKTDFSIIGAIGMGGYGRVFKGEHEGRTVALKILDKAHKNHSISQDFCKEALAWRSLSHRFILPLLGIFEDKVRYLVSPLMTNGTLTQWRKNKPPSIVLEVHRVMQEAAEGVQYIHSEGIVHGDLKGDNVLLDSDFHCQITDFGLTRHGDATATGTMALSPHFAAPELFGKCDGCDRPECEGCRGDIAKEKKRQTEQTDVYAFGCLYYATFFDTIPFEGKSVFHIAWRMTNGIRPERLKSPKMDDKTWNLIQDCLGPDPSKRPTMKQIVERVAKLTPANRPS